MDCMLFDGLSGHFSRTYLFNCADILLQDAGVQALDLSELLTYAIDAQRTEEDLRSTRNHRTRALHTHTVTSYSFHQFIMHSGIARHEALSKPRDANSRKSKTVIQCHYRIRNSEQLWVKEQYVIHDGNVCLLKSCKGAIITRLCGE